MSQGSLGQVGGGSHVLAWCPLPGEAQRKETRLDRWTLGVTPHISGVDQPWGQDQAFLRLEAWKKKLTSQNLGCATLHKGQNK